MADANKVTVDLTTGVGTLSFPHVFASTASIKKDNSGQPTGEKEYDIQIIIPKTQKDDLRAILRAIKTVGEAKWGENWKKVRTPLRDGDKEAGDLTEDGSTKGEKYPERLGAFFLNARSKKPIGVFDRQRNVINDADALYGGCKGKIAVTFYPYSTNGNHGIGCGLNGVQKIADGEAIGGGGKPSVESMFDLLDEDDDLGLDEDDLLADEPEEEPTPPPAKKAAAKKTAAKKTAAKKAAPKPEPVEEVDELDDLDADGDEDDLYADLDD